jgi:serine/threonine-protein kinase
MRCMTDHAMHRTLRLACLLLLPAVAMAAPLPRFTQPNAIWNTDATHLATRSNSALMMTHLAAFSSKGWGDTRNFDFQIDLSFYVLHANASTPTGPIVAFPSTSEYYSPDCEAPGLAFPVPATGGIEGTDPPAYTCDTGADDCHLLVSNDTTHVLYESYFTDSANASGVHAICGLKWDLTRTYPRYGRGEHCTSADGAGFPIAPLLFNADEVWAAAQTSGDLGHAIRFILGNNRMTYRKYVHPSSHGTKATSDTNADAVPYGSRLRLKSGFDVNAFSSNESVRVILRTLQKYGMFLSDGGGVPLTAEVDTYTTHKWSDADVNLDTHSLFGIRPTDFDVIEAGNLLSVTNANDDYNDCVRTPDDFIFIDGYDF